MWRKANRLAGAQLKHCKERGEWAELYFMMMAAGLGMRVSKPLGDFGRYDVGVESHIHHNQARVLRVQVKSTIYKRRGDCYSLNVMGPQRKKYRPGTVDFFAILLIPIRRLVHNPLRRNRQKEQQPPFHPSQQAPKVRPLPRSLALTASRPRPDNPGLQRRASPRRQSTKRMTRKIRIRLPSSQEVECRKRCLAVEE